MNWLDIVIAIILLWAAIVGFRKGMISQAFGILGLLLGIFLGYRFSRLVAGWLNLDESYASILGFVIILVAVIVVSYFVGLITKKIFRLTGFGLLDDLGGLLLGVVKYALVLGLLLGLLANFNRQTKIIKPQVFTESFLYKPLKAMSDAVFPWLLGTRDRARGTESNRQANHNAQAVWKNSGQL